MAATLIPHHDVLLEQLAEVPRPFPLQPSPLMGPADHCSDLEFTSVADKRLSSFKIGGEPRLCFPQVLTACLSGCDEAEVTKVILDLQIHFQEASPSQLEALKLSNALPEQATTCGLIKKTDSERLIGELRVDVHGHPPPPVLDPSEKLCIKHDCFGGGKGFLYPSHYPRPCVQCRVCMRFFTPEHFTTHNHREEEITRTCHWGFDSDNWRHYFRLSKEQRGCPVAKRALELFKDPSGRKRSAKCPEQTEVPAKHSVDYFLALKSEERRKQNLLLQLSQLKTIAAVGEATRTLLKLGGHSDLLSVVDYTEKKESGVTNFDGISDISILQREEGIKEEEELTIDVDGDVAEDILIEDSKKTRPSSGTSDESYEDKTLDSLLAEHLREPVLSLVRARIADSQRAISQQLDTISLERDSLRNENNLLKQNYTNLVAYVQQQQLQQKQMTAALQLQPLLAAAAAAVTTKVPHMPTTSTTASSLPNSILLQHLVMQQSALNGLSTSQNGFSGLSGLDPSQLVSLSMGSSSKQVQLPTASQLDQMGARIQ